MAEPNDEFSETRIVIAEGYEDAIFAKQLTRTPARQLPKFDVWSNESLGSVGGNTGFRKAVMAADIKRNFNEVTDVIILADNDDNHANSFRNICNQIQRAKDAGMLRRNWAVPIDPGVKAVGDPSVWIWMFPSAGESGCLETLLWAAIKNQRGHTDNVECVEKACRCSGANGWPTSKLDKAKVRSFLALACRDNPSVSFNNLWRDFPDLIPMNQRAFTPIADFLRSISRAV